MYSFVFANSLVRQVESPIHFFPNGLQANRYPGLTYFSSVVAFLMCSACLIWPHWTSSSTTGEVPFLSCIFSDDLGERTQALNWHPGIPTSSNKLVTPEVQRMGLGIDANQLNFKSNYSFSLRWRFSTKANFLIVAFTFLVIYKDYTCVDFLVVWLGFG